MVNNRFQPKRVFQVLALVSMSSLAYSETLGQLKQQLEQQMKMIQQLQRKIEQIEKMEKQTPPQEQKVVTPGKFDHSIKLPGSNTSVSWGGYVKFDLIYTDYGSSQQIGDDTLVPTLIPIKGTAEDRKHDLNLHAKESRIWFKTLTPTQWGDFGTHMEIDFSTSDQGNERFSNSYSPRLRDASARLGNWLWGQTWSTFMMLDSKTETNDFTGAVSEVFMRQAQIRYTHPFTGGNLQLALENPETTLSTVEGEKVATGDDKWPDFIGRVNFRDKHYAAILAVMARNFRAQGTFGKIVANDDIWGGGLSIGGWFNPIGKDNFTWQLNYGALGRYLTTNYISDGSLNAQGEVRPIQALGVQSSYQHWWTPSWRSTFLFGYTQADNDLDRTGNRVNKKLWSSHINLMWSPTLFTRVGIEYLHAYRELENGEEGAIHRIQFSGMYTF